MFTGMLKVLPNDDSLATILGHEMSHAILQHAVSILANWPIGKLIGRVGWGQRRRGEEIALLPPTPYTCKRLCLEALNIILFY